MKKWLIILRPLLSLFAILTPAAAASIPVKETIVLQRLSVPRTDVELGMGITVFPPNSSKPHQKANGPETCYVVAGEVTVRIDGKPPQTYRAGQIFGIPALVAHRTTAGPTEARLIASWAREPRVPFNVRLGN